MAPAAYTYATVNIFIGAYLIFVNTVLKSGHIVLRASQSFLRSCLHTPQYEKPLPTLQN